MATPPPNPDTRELPYGWVQQYNWEYRQWFYVNTRENPPRSSWEHPMGPGFAPPPGPPPPDRDYNRSPYGGPPPPPPPPGPPPPDRAYSRSPYGGPPPQGYGGYSGYQQPSQGYYNAPAGGVSGGPPYGPNRAYSPGPRTVYVEEDRQQQKKGPGWGAVAGAGAAGLLGGALLTEAFESHNEHEREEGFEQGYQDGFDNGATGDFGGDF